MANQNPQDIANIKPLEKGLWTFYMKCYKSDLWLLILYRAWEMMMFLKQFTKGSEEPVIEILKILAFISFDVLRSVWGLQAISQRSLRKATVACVTSCIAFIPAFIWCISNILPMISEELWDDYFKFYPQLVFKHFSALAVCLLIHVVFDIIPAFRVRKILAEMKPAQEK